MAVTAFDRPHDLACKCFDSQTHARQVNICCAVAVDAGGRIHIISQLPSFGQGCVQLSCQDPSEHVTLEEVLAGSTLPCWANCLVPNSTGRATVQDTSLNHLLYNRSAYWSISSISVIVDSR